ncbi:MAG TPA: hypothetical protein VJQ79_04550 [Acidimicrobiia bacterium]|nr:hypothetical protein [Acidimicrobiia bacterium]
MLSRWLASPLLTVLVLVGACTATPTGPSPFIGDPTGLEPLPGRLLVLGEDSAIFVVRPDGSDRRDLAAGSEDIVRTQPTWSPDGTRAAWTESARGVTFLVTATADGAEETRSEIPFPALYLAWDPTGSRLALSGNDDDGSLKLTVSVPGGVLEVVDEGAPMWIDWNSSGSELLVHVEDRFEAISMEGGSRRPIAVDGDFRVGIHAGDGLVFTTGNDVGEMLVFGDPDGSVRTELLRVGNPTAFVADTSGRRLAVMSIPSASTQALAEAESGSIPVLSPNRLVVVDLESVQFWEVARARAVAWFFSPAGDHLLYATQVEVDGATRLQWHTWDGLESTSYRTFLPTGVFGRDYLAYFDQYARSHSFWAPDGSAFVYAGGTDLTNRGIWVQPVSDAPPVRVALGEVASWSRK